MIFKSSMGQKRRSFIRKGRKGKLCFSSQESCVIAAVADGKIIEEIISPMQLKLLIHAAKEYYRITKPSKINGEEVGACSGCGMYHMHTKNCLTRKVGKLFKEVKF